MLQNLANKVYETWRDYRYPPKHREFVDEWRLLAGYKKSPDLVPEATNRQLEVLANKLRTKYKKGIYVGAGLTILGIGAIIVSPQIINEIREYSEYLAQILDYVIKPAGAVTGGLGLMHFIRNASLLTEISDYRREV